MATRRTTMRSRSGTKLYAVRDKSGQFQDIQTYQRAHSADMARKSKAETQGSIEKRVRQAATDAVESVKSSMQGAVAAVRQAAQRAVTQVAGRSTAGKKRVKKGAKKTGPTSARKSAAKKTAKKTTRKPAARTGARKTAKKR